MVKQFYPNEPHVLDWLRCFILPTDTVLDVGSGDGRHRDIGAAHMETLDLWPAADPDYLIDLEKEDLPDKSFSVFLMIDLLEHLTKDRGEAILRQAQDRATRAVVVLTPLEWDDNRDTFEDEKGFYFGNEAILHRSLWTLADFDCQWTRVWVPSTHKTFFGYWVKQ